MLSIRFCVYNFSEYVFEGTLFFSDILPGILSLSAKQTMRWKDHCMLHSISLLCRLCTLHYTVPYIDLDYKKN